MIFSILPISSGSGGNCYHISDGKTNILIECGIPIKKIKMALNFNLHTVSACLISHSHGDHSKAVHDILKAGIPCYMSPGCSSSLGLYDHRNVTWMYPFERYEIGSWSVFPFETIHDSEDHLVGDTLGFYLKSKESGECVVFATDTAYMRNRFSRIDHLMIECNYDQESIKKSLDSGDITQAQYNRIIATHFGLDNVVEFLKQNDLSHLKSIHLLHLSNSNSNEELTLKTIQQETGVPVIVCEE
jgi:phosphoribosyl 1,2-cyclic phosphodiesterase